MKEPKQVAEYSYANAVKKWRPAVRLQSDTFECGQVCLNVLHAMMGRCAKEEASSDRPSARGTTISALKAQAKERGLHLKAMLVDYARLGPIPSPSIALTKRGHYLVVGRQSGDSYDVFDPAFGWTRRRAQWLRNNLQDIVLSLAGVDGGNRKSLHGVGIGEIGRVVLLESASHLGRLVIWLSVLSVVLTACLPLLTGSVVTKALGEVAQSTPATIGLGFILITIGSSLSGLISSVLKRRLQSRISISSATWLIDRLGNQASHFFERKPPSALHSYTRSLTALQNWYSDAIESLVRIVVLGLIGVTALFVVSPWLALPGLVSLLVTSALEVWLLSRSKALEGRNLYASRMQSQYLHDLANQFLSFKRFNVLSQVKARYRRIVRLQSRLASSQVVLMGLSTVGRSTAAAAETITFLALSAWLMSKEQFGLGVFVAAGMYKDQLKESLSSTFALWRNFEQLEIHKKNLSELESAPLISQRRNLGVGAGEVVLNSVRFRYSPSDPWVINGASLVVKAGSVTAIKGGSGQGKTTLFRLVCGLSEPASGSVRVDDIDALEIGAGVNAVLQTDSLFHGTLRDNVAFLRRDVTDDQIYAALELVGASFVNKLPMALATPVGSGLAGLSAGQKQRILLARAIVGGPKVLVLDEATSSLDLESERHIFESVRSLGITVLFCSHRPETWSNADCVYELVDGKANRLR